MSERAADYFAEQERTEKAARLKAVARRLLNDQMLKLALLRIDAKERRSVYAALRPHLPFAPLNYKKLMRLAPMPFMHAKEEFVQ